MHSTVLYALRHGSYAIAFAISWSAQVSAVTVTYTDLYSLAVPAGVSSLTLYAAAGGQVAASGNVATGFPHALLWNGNGSASDLHPSAAYRQSSAFDTDGSQQVGNVEGAVTNSNSHAFLWNNGASPIDLNPANYSISTALGTNGGFQVGYGSGTLTGSQNHALLWNNSNAATDLHPATGYVSSVANAIAGGVKVGLGNVSQTVSHAMLWDADNNYVDLHPAGWLSSEIYGVGNGQEVGYARIGSPQAFLWNGTGPAIDLNPTNFTTSVAHGVAGGRQVGYGSGLPTSNNTHALLWTGDAASYVDLHRVLPANFTTSHADSISGNTVYGWARDTTGVYHAIAWSVPEPAALSLAAFAGFALLRRGRRRASFSFQP